VLLLTVLLVHIFSLIIEKARDGLACARTALARFCTRTGTIELHVLDDKYLAFWYRYDQRDHSIEYVL
jgi:hypothetical protein